MFKRLFFAATILSTFATQASAEILYRGTIIWTAVSGCVGEQKGYIFGSQFHPRLLGGNDNFSGLTVVHNFGAAGYQLDSQNFPNALVQVGSGGVGWSAYDFQFPAFVRVISQDPPTLTTASPAIRLVGKIKNPWGDQANCLVDFNASYVKRVP